MANLMQWFLPIEMIASLAACSLLLAAIKINEKLYDQLSKGKIFIFSAIFFLIVALAVIKLILFVFPTSTAIHNLYGSYFWLASFLSSFAKMLADLALLFVMFLFLTRTVPTPWVALTAVVATLAVLAISDRLNLVRGVVLAANGQISWLIIIPRIAELAAILYLIFRLYILSRLQVPAAVLGQR